ncbi:hypothetical protein BGZ63DRAFT_368601 [Mariannaea sp. PMI_226]|nr:hypothetical protein BGZ63DRAFT_368601 [Mariannaea sp. PMI_226]
MRLGCWACKARKVKCDERPNGCVNCERLRISCSQSPRGNGDGENDVIISEHEVDQGRQRTFRSCKLCRLSKVRCSGERPACLRCRSRCVACSYDAKEVPQWLSKARASSSVLRTRPSPASPHSRAASKDPDTSLDDVSQAERNGNVLLLVVCALGAKFYSARHNSQSHVADGIGLRAGNQWSCRAQQLLFTCLNNSSIETAMAAVLLHEHELRVGNYASAFMITGFAVRLSQGLQINIETSADSFRMTTEASSPSIRESRRRLMWSIYTMDAWVGSGVDELTLIRESNIHIRLPCNERDFILEQSVDQDNHQLIELGLSGPISPVFDVAAHFLRLVSIRRRVLRYVKHLDATAPPWAPESEYNTLHAECLDWRNLLPASLHFTRSAIHQRKMSTQHGALCFLHITYHQTMCDLTRIGMPELFRIRVNISFPPEQITFLRQVQDECFDNCMSISSIFRESLRHGMAGLADTWLCVVAHDVSRVLVYYATNYLGSPKRHDDVQLRPQIRGALQANVQALEKMAQIQALARPLVSVSWFSY